MGRRRWGPALCWALVVAALAGFAGWGGFDGAAGATRQDDPAAQATATREAELAELEALRTRVAELEAELAVACATPTPAASPTPVPPAAAGQAVPYGDRWMVTVISATPRPTVQQYTATGAFVEITLSVANNTSDTRFFPYDDLVLTDSQGRSVGVALEASVAIGGVQRSNLAGFETKELQYIFDVPAGAGSTFILESKSDPAFRVQVELSGRG